MRIVWGLSHEMWGENLKNSAKKLREMQVKIPTARRLKGMDPLPTVAHDMP